jgi:AraC-like DNA-binding protein
MELDWDIRSVVLIIAAFQAIIVSTLLLIRSRKSGGLPDRLLAFFLLAITANLAEHIFGWLGLYENQRLTYFPFGGSFVFAPLGYLYVKSITNSREKWHQKQWLHFIPAVIYFTVHFIAWARPLAQKQQAIDWLWQHKWHQAEGYGNILLFSIYLYKIIRHYTAYTKWLPTEYSNTEKLQLRWIRNFIILLGVYYAVCLGFGIYSELYGWYGYKVQFWQYLALAIIIYYASATGYAYVQKYNVAFSMNKTAQPPVSEPITATSLNNTDIPKVFPPASKALEAIQQQLLIHLQHNKPWLDPELSLSQLALQLQNINGYRVEAVIEKLKTGEQKTQTLTGIAYDCGFNSKATFNRAFKKATGTNPGEFAQKL